MNISYAKRFPDSYYRKDAKWAYVVLLDPKQETPNYSQLDERTDYFYEAVTSPGMVSTTPGVGSAYLGAYKDKNNRWFDGSKTYRLHVPPNPPAKNFWSLTIYDTYNRVQIDTRRRWPIFFPQGGLEEERRRFGGFVCRPEAAGGLGAELDRNGAGQGVVRVLPLLRADRRLLRAHVCAAGFEEVPK